MPSLTASREMPPGHDASRITGLMRAKYGMEKPRKKLLALADLDSGTWLGAGLCRNG